MNHNNLDSNTLMGLPLPLEETPNSPKPPRLSITYHKDEIDDLVQDGIDTVVSAAEQNSSVLLLFIGQLRFVRMIQRQLEDTDMEVILDGNA